MKSRDRVVAICAFYFLYAGGFNPTSILPTAGKSGFDSMVAFGSLRTASASAFPAGRFSFTQHFTPYGGGRTIPAMLSLTPHPASFSVFSRSSAKAAASISPIFVNSTIAPACGFRTATIESCSPFPIRREASLSSILTRASRSSSATRLASAALFSAAAVCSWSRTISPWRTSLSSFWSLLNFRLFHQWRMPKTDSPATPITTITPKISSHTSIRAKSASSSDLSIDDTELPTCAAFVVIIFGLISLTIPTLALLRLLERHRRRL